MMIIAEYIYIIGITIFFPIFKDHRRFNYLFQYNIATVNYFNNYNFTLMLCYILITHTQIIRPNLQNSLIKD